MRLLTYNVWFGRFEFEARTRAILEIIKNRADVACLQEVTPKFVDMMHSDKEILETFYVDSFPVQPYGKLVVSVVS